jgi:hypothetical protein
MVQFVYQLTIFINCVKRKIKSLLLASSRHNPVYNCSHYEIFICNSMLLIVYKNDAIAVQIPLWQSSLSQTLPKKRRIEYGWFSLFMLEVWNSHDSGALITAQWRDKLSQLRARRNINNRYGAYYFSQLNNMCCGCRAITVHLFYDLTSQLPFISSKQIKGGKTCFNHMFLSSSLLLLNY